jgi:hypothetical protein
MGSYDPSNDAAMVWKRHAGVTYRVNRPGALPSASCPGFILGLPLLEMLEASSSLRKNSKVWGFSVPRGIDVALILVFSFRIEDFSCRLGGV